MCCVFATTDIGASDKYRPAGEEMAPYRAPRPSPFCRKKANKNIGYVAKLLPRGKALYEKPSRTDNELFLVACLLRLKEAKDVDDRLVAALHFNPRLRELGPRALADRVGVGVWN